MKLIFISDKIQSPKYRLTARLPLIFISFAITKGKMYKYHGKRNTIVMQEGVDAKRFNTVVYGGIYGIKDDYYLKVLDYHMGCSKAKVENNTYDINHRINTQIIPIFFNSIDELDRLLYREGIPQFVDAYFGNIEHPYVNKRIFKNNATNKIFRVQNGVNPALLLQYKTIKGDD